MKTTNLKFAALALGAGVLALGSVTSCTKTKTVTNTVVDSVAYTKAATPPSNPDNATDAGGVDSANLVAYWSFNSTLTEKVESLTGTGTNVIYGTGEKEPVTRVRAAPMRYIPTRVPHCRRYRVFPWLSG